MRATMALRPPTMDGYIVPTARPTPHGSVRSMLPLGADHYGTPHRRVLRMGDWGCAAAPGWGRLYPPREAVRGPWTSPPYHLRLGQGVTADILTGMTAGQAYSPPYVALPATSVTYPDILSQMPDSPVYAPPAVAAPYSPPFSGPTAAYSTGAPAGPPTPTAAAPLPFGSLLGVGGLSWGSWAVIGASALVLVLVMRRR